jgi:hypothetical protein
MSGLLFSNDKKVSIALAEKLTGQGYGVTKKIEPAIGLQERTFLLL